MRIADTSAARDVLAERRRQVTEEGWTPEHDDEHQVGELAVAAGAYAFYAGNQAPSRTAQLPGWEDWIKIVWPWDVKWWKPKDARTNLVKAAALLLAEIERLDRLEAREKARPGDQPG